MMRRAMNAIVAVLLLGPIAAAEDVVTLTSSGAEGNRFQVVGTIVDYSGREIVIQLASGSQQKYPSRQVVEIATTYLPEQLDADKLLASGQYKAALAKYESAIKGEKENRRWVRRQLLARMSECLQALGQVTQAGDYFLLLAKEDPQTPYFAAIPLPWQPFEMSPTIEQKAKGWLAQPSEAAALLGASYLVGTTSQQLALAKLQQLAASKDPRIAALAEAQAWRATLVTASPEQLAMWTRKVDGFPEELRAGPYFILGRAWANRQQYDRAALALMHVPILYPDRRQLAAESLLLSASALNRAGSKTEAQKLSRELMASYPETRSAQEAVSLFQKQ